MRRLLSILFVLLCVIALSASASVALAYTLEELTKGSAMVLQGTVKKAEAKWVGKRIVTEVTLTVKESFKGTAPGEVILYTPGGVVDGVGMKVAGVATFTEKEEVVVFLQSYKGTLSPLGLGQGKYRITTDATGKKTATPEVDGLSLMRKLPDGTMSPVDPPRATSLSSLSSEIKKFNK